MNNDVDLTGMVFQKREIVSEERSILYFVLNVRDSFFDQNGEIITNYQKVSCAISKRSDQQYTKKYDYLKKNLVERSVIRLSGRLSHFTKEYIVPDTGEKVNVLLNQVWIKDYMFIKRVSDNRPNEREHEQAQPVENEPAEKEQAVEKYNESKEDQQILDSLYPYSHSMNMGHY